MDNIRKKVFAPGGLEALTEYIKDLRGDLAELATRVSDALQEVGGAILTLDESRAYVSARVSLTLAVSGWVEDSSAGVSDRYPYKYVLALSGVSADTRVDAVLDALSSATAGACGLCSVTETGEDVVIFRSMTIPPTALTGTLYITQGENLEEGNGGNI